MPMARKQNASELTVVPFLFTVSVVNHSTGSGFTSPAKLLQPPSETALAAHVDTAATPWYAREGPG